MTLEEKVCKKIYDENYKNYGWGDNGALLNYWSLKMWKRELDKLNYFWRSTAPFQIKRVEDRIKYYEERLKSYDYCKNPNWVDPDPYVEEDYVIEYKAEIAEKYKRAEESIAKSKEKDNNKTRFRKAIECLCDWPIFTFFAAFPTAFFIISLLGVFVGNLEYFFAALVFLGIAGGAAWAMYCEGSKRLREKENMFANYAMSADDDYDNADDL